MKKRIECKIFGRVQMVMYRDFCVRKARILSILGAVKNEHDGTVCVVAEGEESALFSFIEMLKRGPLLAHVEQVEVVWREASGEFNNFSIAYE